jgi:transcriptional regulator with XRE-family HTH domain
MTSNDMTPEQCEAQFARFMAFVREGKDLSQGGLAQRLGKSRSVVSFFESARRPLKPDEFPTWADALGVDAQDIEALRYLSFGYRRWEDEWTFWTDIEDPEAFEYDSDDPEEMYFGMYYDLEELLNKMAGKKICQRGGDRYGIELEILLHRASNRNTIVLHLPRQPFLGDPNNHSEAKTLGSLEDLELLLAQSTAEQIALTAAFVRGLHAQARSRLRTKCS